MPTGTNSHPTSDIHTHTNTPSGSPVLSKDLPNSRDDETPRNPKPSPGAGATRAERIADKAAHKAAKDEQEYDAEKGIVSH